MLKKTERLDRRLFTEYFAKGKRNHNTHTTIITSPHSRLLVSVVVGKKVAKKAHDRNRLRRQVYSVVELIKSERKPKGVFIIILKPAVTKLTQKALRTVLDKEVGLIMK